MTEQANGFRTYRISAGPSQDLWSVFISENRKRFSVVWALDGQQQRELFVSVDRDERSITSAGISTDRKTLLVTVEYVRDDTTALSDTVCIPLVDLMPLKVKAIVEQRDVQAYVDLARNSQQNPEQRARPMMCFTQMNHDLNQGGSK